MQNTETKSRVDFPKTLEQLREEQNRVKDRVEKTFPVTELPAAYAERINNPGDDILSRAMGMIHRPQKLLKQVMEYEDARRIVWKIGQAKLALRDKTWIVNDSNRENITQMVKYFICDPSCTLDLNKGLYLFGANGLGKTFLMEVMQVFADAARIEQRVFQTISAIDVALKAKKATAKDEDPIDTYSNGSTIFCFDDIGDEPGAVKIYGNDTPVMETILSRRYKKFINGFCLTHATSNDTPDELSAKYGSRVKDRMNEMFNYVFFDGKSLRT